MQKHELSPGTVLGERYQVVRKLGAGGFSSVYHVQDKDGVECALKILHFAEKPNQETLKRFEREARLQKRIVDPKVCQLIDFTQLDGFPALLIELVDGWTLHHFLSLRPMPLEGAIALFAESASAVAVLHQHGIVHRDLKPANIMVTRSGLLKVMDLGLSWTAEVTALTAAGSVMGTPTHMPPERIRSGQNLPQGDVYSLGVMGYQFFTGSLPFDAPSIMQLLRLQIEKTPLPIQALRPDTPPAMQDLIMECLAKDPADRPADATVLAERLHQLFEGSAQPRQDLLNLIQQMQEKPAQPSSVAPVSTQGIFAAEDMSTINAAEDFDDLLSF